MADAATEPIELTTDELRRLTKRKQHAAQARVLETLGIPFQRHPIDGSVVCGREAARRALAQAPELEAPGAGRAEASNGINWQVKA